jgi:hypothetical protein
MCDSFLFQCAIEQVSKESRSEDVREHLENGNVARILMIVLH